MQVFKTYFQLLIGKRKAVIMYFAIFFGMAVVSTMISRDGTSSSNFESTKVELAIIDRDESKLSKALTAYLTDKNEIIDVEDDEDKIQDALYWGDVYYVLIIPEDFEKNYTNGKKVDLITEKYDGSQSTAYVDEEIKQYITQLEIYQTAGYKVSEMIPKIEKNLKHTTKVEIAAMEDGEVANQKAEGMSDFFLRVPYALVSICVIVVGGILVLFQQEDVRKRSVCSSTSLSSQNIQILLASAVFSVITILVIIVLAIVVSGGDLVGKMHFLYYTINVICFMAVCVALSFALGVLFDNDLQINACSNIFSLGFCFIGGIFVPLSVMPKGVVKAAHFVPSYWYAIANDLVSYMTKVDTSFIHSFAQCCGVQLAFAAALLCLGTVISKKKQIF